MNSRGIKNLILLFILLFVPVLAYLLLKTGTNHYMPLPVYGERYVEERMVDGELQLDTVYHTLGNFKLVNQFGDTITQDSLENTLYVADFFFVTCPTICPKMSTQMARLQEKFQTTPRVKFLSFTVNPEVDSVPVLAEYGKEYGAMRSKWHLLTGNKAHIYDLARRDYLVNALQGDGGPEDFIHTELFVLIDKDKHIRGFYDGTSAGAVDTLIDEMKVLMKEQLAGKK